MQLEPEQEEIYVVWNNGEQSTTLKTIETPEKTQEVSTYEVTFVLTDEDTGEELKGVDIEILGYGDLKTDSDGEATIFVEESDNLDYSVDLNDYKKIDETIEDVTEEIEITIKLDQEQNFEYLDNLETDKGGVFYQNADGERFVISEGESFSDVFDNLDEIEESDDGLIAWVVDDVDAIAKSDDGVETILGFSDDDEIEDTGFFSRAATGSGTPQPWQGDYTLDKIEETEEGILTEWSEAESEVTSENFDLLDADGEILHEGDTFEKLTIIDADFNSVERTGFGGEITAGEDVTITPDEKQTIENIKDIGDYNVEIYTDGGEIIISLE
ncbi:hypothetical protein AMET1_0001 [Methanonatronarchaeum thermophilum]|uniref:Uncharacterized protein n=1 Tax=Methanonatronarchaeum thermophilum TaxID=1927129 RepID=A0A1Y3GDL6_9EURY|nr:hypothetical protein AMET1_0001 [Methanonatronarchaeum thermophilum]